MEYLIKISTGEEKARWRNEQSKIVIPNSSDVIFCHGVARPFDVGDDHFLAEATVNKPTLGPDQKRGPEDVVIDVGAQTVTVNKPAIDLTAQELSDRDRNVVFDQFEARFTTQEWDDATDYVYESDTTTGKPKRRALVQGLTRAQARNKVDLLDSKTSAFLSLLVTGGVISEARKTEILTP
jgi:hypothetical protein